MKRNFIIIFLVFSSFHLVGQITLTRQTHLGQIGDSALYHVKSSPSINVSNYGAQISWNINVSPDTAYWYRYISKDESMIGDSFPLTSIVESSNNTENYYTVSDTDYSLVGEYIPNAVFMTFSNPREFIKFPLTYNDEYNETFAGKLYNAYGQEFDRSGNIKIAGDGYGTLTLPYGTINNVLRVVHTADYSDEFMGSTIYHYTDSIFIWYNQNTRTHLASYTVAYANNTKVMEYISYIDEDNLVSETEPTAIFFNNTDITGINIYPNPAVQRITVSSDKIMSSIRISDISGKTIISSISNNTKHQMDVSGLLPGIYLLYIRNESSEICKRLIIK